MSISYIVNFEFYIVNFEFYIVNFEFYIVRLEKPFCNQGSLSA
jgi:hypothetical protein